MIDLIKKLANEILKSGKPITSISEKSGISRGMIYKILKNEINNISLETINAICKAINIDAKDLYENETKQTENTIVIFGRGQGRKEYHLSEEQLQIINNLAEMMDNSNDDDKF